MKALALLLLLVSACGETGQTHVAMPLIGTGASPTPIEVEDGTIELTRAEIGFGPLYLCATTGADLDLCPVAVAEMIDSVTIDALDPEERPLAEVAGVSGTVRSATFDYGISYLLTSSGAQPTAGAPSGHSLVLEGTLTRDGETFELIAAVDAAPRNAGDSAVRGAPIVRDLGEPTSALVVHADVARWLEGIDLSELEPDDGRVTIGPGTDAYNTIVLGMTARRPLELRFEP